ncbi:hypothetical protein BSKO_13299 [Bryopsis sp. KO-2023]|nr:hypothetical protein BSKO_13299 [Bryopsis sp. KO-2023]
MDEEVEGSSRGRDEVVSNLEIFPDKSARRLFKFMYTGVWMSAAGLVITAGMKWSNRFENDADGRRYARANSTIALICMVTTLSCLVAFTRKCIIALRSGKKWSRRRRVFTSIHFGVLASHSIGTVFYSLPNILDIINIHGRFLEAMGMLRFTMWNNIFFLFVLHSKLLNLWVDEKGQPIGSYDSILADAPLKQNLHLGLFWVVYECVPIGVFTYGVVMKEGWNLEVDQGCTPNMRVVVMGACFSAAVFIYQATSLLFLYNAYRQLKQRPYNSFRVTNVWLRYHFLQNAVVGDFISFSFMLFFWVKTGTCSGSGLTWSGLIPAHWAMTVLSVVNCFLWMPVHSQEKGNFALESENLVWLEGSSDGGAGEKPHLDKFCFEKAMKLWYWSLGVYGYDSDRNDFFDPDYPPLNAKSALNLYNLQDYHAIHMADVNVIVSWSSDTILICFRGTYNMKNVWTDLQFVRVVHPPKRGMYLMRTQPLVHQGFLESWSGLKDCVINKIDEILRGDRFDSDRCRILVTGHSLGGALAVLASYDIAKRFELGVDRISCYTYGALRVGNHAFVRDYNTVVPDTWQVVNDRDVVPRMPKFWVLFKHVGERVIINSAGDMIVSPLFVELTLYNPPTLYGKSTSVRQHLMLNYRKSLVSIVKGQFVVRKSMRGGADAIGALAQKADRPLESVLDLKPESLKGVDPGGGEICAKVWSRRTALWGLHLFRLRELLPCFGNPESMDSDSEDGGDRVELMTYSERVQEMVENPPVG